jgi:hypothetical protein
MCAAWVPQVRAYKQLASLQGVCIPVLEAAGLLGDCNVIVAVSGGQRIDTDDPPADSSHQMRWDVLESLRRIHDCGVLHGNLDTRSFFVQQGPQVRVVLALWQARCQKRVSKHLHVRPPCQL